MSNRVSLPVPQRLPKPIDASAAASSNAEVRRLTDGAGETSIVIAHFDQHRASTYVAAVHPARRDVHLGRSATRKTVDPKADFPTPGGGRHWESKIDVGLAGCDALSTPGPGAGVTP